MGKKTMIKGKPITSTKLKKPVQADSSDEEPAEEIKISAKSKKKMSAHKKQKIVKVVASKPKRPVIPNVIYIGHLPKHCEERELIGFLKQFGILTQLRLCRSEKTGGSKGYAFAKFQDQEVAAIVAEALNGYLLFQSKLVSHVLAPEQIHLKLFTSKTRTVFQKKTIKRDGPKSMEKMAEISQRLIDREQQKREKLKAMGIDYDFPGYAGCANNKQEEKEEESEVKKGTKAETQKSTTSEKKRKHSFDAKEDEELKSQKASKKDKESSQSEKKKKKKDKKRRKSA